MPGSFYNIIVQSVALIVESFFLPILVGSVRWARVAQTALVTL